MTKVLELTRHQETERLMSDSPPGITAAPNGDNLRHFDVTVSGPESSPYEGESCSAIEDMDAGVCEVSNDLY